MSTPKITEVTSFSRGTTPRVTLNVAPSEVLNGAVLHLCIKQGKQAVIVKETKDLTIDLGTGTVAVTLSQTETLRFAEGTAECQIRGVTASGAAWATDIEPVQILRILENGVITYDNE